jgi:hypothetical protein
MRIVFVDARSRADWRSFARFVVKTSRAVLRRAILRSTAQRSAARLVWTPLNRLAFVGDHSSMAYYVHVLQRSKIIITST